VFPKIHFVLSIIHLSGMEKKKTSNTAQLIPLIRARAAFAQGF
jgi:hypothetical protein